MPFSSHLWQSKLANRECNQGIATLRNGKLFGCSLSVLDRFVLDSFSFSRHLAHFYNTSIGHRWSSFGWLILYDSSYKATVPRSRADHFVRFFVQNHRAGASSAPFCTILRTKPRRRGLERPILYDSSYKATVPRSRADHFVRFFVQSHRAGASSATFCTILRTKTPRRGLERHILYDSSYKTTAPEPRPAHFVRFFVQNHRAGATYCNYQHVSLKYR
jgi:hypothetical protein